jgi:hypothetical protein
MMQQHQHHHQHQPHSTQKRNHRSIHHPSNETMTNPHETSLLLQPSLPTAIENMNGKTPARNTTATSTSNTTVKNRRVALGDISNRKGVNVQRPPPSHHSVVSGTTKQPEPATVHVQPFSHHQQSQQQQQHRNELRHRVGSVHFILPDQTIPDDEVDGNGISLQKRDDTITALPSKLSLLPVRDDEVEIERSAGRLYNDQSSYGDDDDAAAVLLIEGATTYREEWIQSLDELHQHRLRMTENKVQACIQKLEQIAVLDIDADWTSQQDHHFYNSEPPTDHDGLFGHHDDTPSTSLWTDGSDEIHSWSASIDFPPSP